MVGDNATATNIGLLKSEFGFEICDLSIVYAQCIAYEHYFASLIGR